MADIAVMADVAECRSRRRRMDLSTLLLRKGCISHVVCANVTQFIGIMGSLILAGINKETWESMQIFAPETFMWDGMLKHRITSHW